MKFLKSFGILTLLALLAVTVSCSDEENGISTGNKEDLAVTSNVMDVSVTTASLNGYMNPDKIPSSTKRVYLGIQLSADREMGDPTKERVKKVQKDYILGAPGQDRTISARFGGLKPGAVYYYRTYVVCDRQVYYGETKSVTIKNMVNAVTKCSVEDITSSEAQFWYDVDAHSLPDYDYDTDLEVDVVKVGVVVSKDQNHIANADSVEVYSDTDSKDPVYSDYKAWNYYDEYTRNVIVNFYKLNDGNVTIKGLESATTYYYRTYTSVNDAMVLGDLSSFTTK